MVGDYTVWLEMERPEGCLDKSSFCVRTFGTIYTVDIIGNKPRTILDADERRKTQILFF